MPANDRPFKKGDTVYVIREQHGWHDGNLKGTVSRVYQNKQGIYSYDVEVSSELMGDYVVEVEHTRDLIKA